jgi:hypothetical protein
MNGGHALKVRGRRPVHGCPCHDAAVEAAGKMPEIAEQTRGTRTRSVEGSPTPPPRPGSLTRNDSAAASPCRPERSYPRVTVR